MTPVTSIKVGSSYINGDIEIAGAVINGQLITITGVGLGTVTSVSVATANGVSGSVANPTTTPAITLSLGAITPTSVAASGTVTGSNLSGTNTGDQTNISGNAATVTTNANLTGPVTSVGNATTIAAGVVTEAMQVLADNTTQNVSTSAHGYAPKAPNDAAKFLNGVGAYALPNLTLLKANSGTDTTATALNVDTVSITGLTANDTLVIFTTLASITQQTTDPHIYSATDSLKIVDLIAATNLGIGLHRPTMVILRQEQSANTSILPQQIATGGSPFTPGTITTTTAWTSTWSLALRHGGVTSGGTFQWSWAVYKLTGQ